MGGLPSHAQAALLTGPVAAPLLPRLSDAPQLLLTPETELENGFGFQADGTLHVAIRTELPDVTPEMIDFWFGWHSAEPARYKLWHPRAHVHAQWESAESPQQAQSKGRARYVGRVSFVDEYLGSRLQRGDRIPSARCVGDLMSLCLPNAGAGDGGGGADQLCECPA